VKELPISLRNHSQDVVSHTRTLQREGDFRGESQPFQPNPAEQQAAERLGKPPPGERRPSGEREINPYLSWEFMIETHDGTATLEWKGKSGSPEQNPWQVIDRMLSIMNQQAPPEGRISFSEIVDIHIPGMPDKPFFTEVNKDDLEKFIQEQEGKKPKDIPPE
jgi:hypothetical protein